MCGFVGLRALDGLAVERYERLSDALSSIRHRGPDGEERFQTSWLLLAHARLSIIDLTAAAQQPMLDSSGRYALTFNGEIYNYRELATQYLADDNEVNRNSDTAVLLAMYKRFGRECLKYLDGMFAFVVVDLQERTLFLARDRFGEKPLYMLQAQGMVAFASEMTALRRLFPDFPWEIDLVSLAIYHIVGSVPPPRTIYRNVHAVRSAHWMEIDSSGDVREGSYWCLAQAAAEHVATPMVSYVDTVARCQHYLLHAMRSRMVSDVPVGVFLSGGLDSGSILSLQAAQNFAALEALCIDFPDQRFSEYRLAEATANVFGARLHRSVVTPESFMEHLDDFFTISDQPTTDGFNAYFASMHAKALGIKVWLSGVGGDELFGGYPSFRRIGRLSRLSQLMQLSLPGAVTDTWANYFPYYLKFSRLLHLCLSGDPVKRAYQGLRNPTPKSNVLSVLSRESFAIDCDLTAVLDSLYPSTEYCRDDFQRASAMESGVYMGSQLLRDIDNFSMAHSIEVRAPFLDHELFGFVFSLPAQFKIREGNKKPLLIDALPYPLPGAVLEQPKMGFTFPVENWLKGHMASSFRNHVLTERNRMFWDISALENMWDMYMKGRLHWSVLWSYYAFARWWGAHCEQI